MRHKVCRTRLTNFFGKNVTFIHCIFSLKHSTLSCSNYHSCMREEQPNSSFTFTGTEAQENYWSIVYYAWWLLAQNVVFHTGFGFSLAAWRHLGLSSPHKSDAATFICSVWILRLSWEEVRAWHLFLVCIFCSCTLLANPYPT